MLSWKQERILQWGLTCQELCLRAMAEMCSGESEAPEVNLEAIPVPGRDLAEGFNKCRTINLPLDLLMARDG